MSQVGNTGYGPPASRLNKKLDMFISKYSNALTGSSGCFGGTVGSVHPDLYISLFESFSSSALQD